MRCLESVKIQFERPHTSGGEATARKSAEVTREKKVTFREVAQLD